MVSAVFGLSVETSLPQRPKQYRAQETKDQNEEAAATGRTFFSQLFGTFLWRFAY
jgi:hypothetical protein